MIKLKQESAVILTVHNDTVMLPKLETSKTFLQKPKRNDKTL